MLFDYVIRGGTVVTPTGPAQIDVAVLGERVGALADYGVLDDVARQTIPAHGKIVVPGGIDPHVHCSWPAYLEEDGSSVLSAGPDRVSEAALHGGTTTLVDFCPVWAGDSIGRGLEKVTASWAESSLCDYAFHVMVMGEIDDKLMGEIPGAIATGNPSVKMFTTNITPSRRGRRVPYGQIMEILRHIADAGGVAAIHAEDDDIVMNNYARHEASGKSDFRYLPDVHSSISEDLSFRKVIRASELAGGAALYMMHVSARSGVDAVREARSKGAPIFAETLHQYAVFSREDYSRPNGQIYHTYPSLKEPDDCQALWAGMQEGVVHTVATDAICTPLATKVMGDRVDNVTGGNVGVEPRMAVVYTESVVDRSFSLNQFVEITSANAAKILGLYPRKGAICVGADADLVLLDPTVDRVLEAADLHESDYSPWAGRRVSAWPVLTMRRGQVVSERGELQSGVGKGVFVPRHIDERVLAGRL